MYRTYQEYSSAHTVARIIVRHGISEWKSYMSDTPLDTLRMVAPAITPREAVQLFANVDNKSVHTPEGRMWMIRNVARTIRDSYRHSEVDWRVLVRAWFKGSYAR